MRVAFLVPLKRFDLAKERLRASPDLDVTALAEALALGVVTSCAPRPVYVLAESDEVADFAVRHGARVRRSHAASLNEAVQGAYDELGTHFGQLIVAHGDLRQPAGLGSFEPSPGVTIITDHLNDGTNVLVVPTGLRFRFAYGPGSAARHRDEALRLGQSVTVISDSPWRFDVDEPRDLSP